MRARLDYTRQSSRGDNLPHPATYVRWWHEVLERLTRTSISYSESPSICKLNGDAVALSAATNPLAAGDLRREQSLDATNRSWGARVYPSAADPPVLSTAAQCHARVVRGSLCASEQRVHVVHDILPDTYPSISTFVPRGWTPLPDPARLLPVALVLWRLVWTSAEHTRPTRSYPV